MQLKIKHIQAKKLYDKLIKEERSRRYMGLLNDYHRETYDHSLRVCLLSLDLGVENELSQTDLWSLGYAGLLHDVGKTQISYDILTNTGSLDKDKYKEIQGHVRLSFMVLENCEDELVKEIVVAHHEFTKRPYPRNGIDRRKKKRGKGERRKRKSRIGKMAQILAIADIADALMNRRTYKRAFTKKEIKEVLIEEYTGDHRLLNQVLSRLNGDGVDN
jgi:HD-GYP domain-containing protein (c-di-GMP phosphodiesterase class II)